MKTAVFLCSLFALAASWRLRGDDVPSNFEDLVKQKGYAVESYDVQTDDGYILRMFRMPKGKNENSENTIEEKDSSSSSGSDETDKKVVFLMHGLMTNAECFIQGEPSNSLAFYLADAGYDVFLGNSRGTIYGQRHTALNPDKDAAFWRYCFDEIGMKDLPAMIKKALEVSGQDKVKFIGHTEGTTAFYAMASEVSDMKDKVERHISLCPVVFMKNSDNEILETAQEHLSEKSWIMKNVGTNTFSPSEDLMHDAKEDCMESVNDEKLCKNSYFLMNGFKSSHLDKNTIEKFMSRVPSTASVREIMHMAQIKKTGTFTKYSEDLDGEEYDLSNAKIPVALFYTENDSLCSTEDIETLVNKLPKVFKKTVMEDLDNNLDMLFSEDMTNLLKKVDEALKEKLDDNNRSQ